MDEAAQALESARPWTEQLQIRDDFQPPLLHLIVALAIRVNPSEWWLRTWGALIPGILTIIGSYVVAIELGRLVFKPHPVRHDTKLAKLNRPAKRRRPQLISKVADLIQQFKTYLSTLDRSILLASSTALLLTTSSFHIFFSQELRQYSLPAMWGIWSWWVLIKISPIKTSSRQWWGWGLGWVSLSTLGLYSSYLYPFLLLSQVVWVGVRLSRHPKHQPCHADTTIPACREWNPEPGSASRYGSASSTSTGLPKSIDLSNRTDSSIVNSKIAHHPASSHQKLATICPWFHWLTLGLFMILAFLPWLPSFIDQLNAGQMLRLSLPGWETVVSTPQIKALALVGGKFLFGVSDITPNPRLIMITMIFFGLVGICGFWFQRIVASQANAISDQPTVSRTGLAQTWLLLLIAFLLPLLSAWLVSFIVPVLQPKRVLYLLPFWYLGLSLLITIVLSSYQSWRVKIWPALLLGLLLIFNLGSTSLYWFDPTLQRENWRRAWLDINQTYGDNTPKLFLFDGPFASWAWYDRQLSLPTSTNDFSFIGVRTADQTQATSLVESASNHFTQPIIIYFDYLTDLTDPNRLVLAELALQGYSPAEVLDYPNIGFVRVFRK